MILHLSTPLSMTINDHISKENFPLYQASMDDATHMLSALRKDELTVKVDLKLAFRMVLVWHQDWEQLDLNWKEAYYVDTCLPFVLRSAPYLSTSLPKPSNGSYNTTMGCNGLFTIWMTTS